MWARSIHAGPVFCTKPLGLRGGGQHRNRGFFKKVIILLYKIMWGFPDGSDGKESAYNAEDPGSSPGSKDPLEEGMATHSSILAWRTPWTEEPGWLQSMGSQESDMT